MPRMALAAPTRDDDVEDRQRAVAARKLIHGGHDRNTTSCLESMKLVRGSGENAAETSVQRRIDEERPEEARRVPSLLAHQQRAGPTGQHQREADARGGDRQLQRRDEAKKPGDGRPFEAVPGGAPADQRQRRHDCHPKCATSGALRSPVSDRCWRPALWPDSPRPLQGPVPRLRRPSPRYPRQASEIAVNADPLVAGAA